MDNGNSFCVYNLDRGISLNSKVSLADCANQPLKILRLIVSGIALDAESGLWLKPLYGPPAVPRIFPFDLLYLDKDQRVLQALEIFPEVDLPACPPEADSALLLPQKVLHATGTACGHRLLVCPSEAMDRELARIGGVQAHATVAIRQADVSKPPAILPETASSVSGNGPSTVKRVDDQHSSQQKNGSKVPITKKPSRQDEEREAPSRPLDSDEALRTPTIAITEVIIEKPPATSVLPAPALHDPGDLFGNWVDSPTTPPAWIAHQSLSGAQLPEPGPVSAAAEKAERAGATHALHKGPAGEIGGTTETLADPRSATVSKSRLQSESAPVRKQGELKEADGKPDSRDLRTQSPPTPAPNPRQGPKAAPVSASERSPSTTFTAAQFGMWHVSLPTAIGAVVAPTNRPANKDNRAPAKPPSSAVSSSSGKAVRPAPANAPSASASSPAQSGLKTQSPPAPVPQKSDSGEPASAAVPLADGVGSKPSVEPSKESTAGTVLTSNSVSASIFKPSPGPEEAPLKPRSVVPSSNGQKGSSLQLKTDGSENRQLEARPPTSVQEAAKQTEVKTLAAKPAGGLSTAIPLPSPPKPAPNGKPGAQLPPTGTNGNKGSDSLSLKARLKRWLHPVTPPTDRRRANRRYVPGVVAHYYTGGAPKPHDVADISMSGFYLLTEERWMPGTMIQMTLQKPCARGERKQSITVLSRIVRKGSDGVGAEFVMPESIDSRSHDVQPAQPTDRFALARFL